MGTKKKQKQITIHFSEEYSYILDEMKMAAKTNFRTIEQQIVYTLSLVTGRPIAAEPSADTGWDIPTTEELDAAAKEAFGGSAVYNTDPTTAEG